MNSTRSSTAPGSAPTAAASAGEVTEPSTLRPDVDWRAHVTPALLYAAVTGLFFLNIVLHPLSRTPPLGGDGFVTFWNYWWARQALVDLHVNPLRTTYLTYPHETSLVFHSHDLLHGILTIPLQLLVAGFPGLVLSVNTILFLCFFLSAFAMYLSTWTLTRHRVAATIAGFGYAFSAFHMTWKVMPVTGALYWLPLFAWLFLRAARRRTRLGWLLPGLCFGLCTFQSLYYTLFLALLAAFLSVFVVLSETDRPQWLRRLLAVNAAILVFALPMAAVVADDLERTVYETPGTVSGAPLAVDLDCRRSMDVAGLVIPSAEQGLWRWFAGPWNAYLRRPSCHWPLFGENGIGGYGVYVGVVPLLLAGLAWGAGDRKAIVSWTLCAIGFAALALGPNLHVAGHIFRHPWLPLPYRLSLVGPAFFANLYRGPWLFFAPALFAIWTLAAFGLRRVLCARGSGLRPMIWAPIIGWLVVDYAAPPFSSWPLHVPAVYSRIAADPRAVAVYEMPADDFTQLEYYGFLQTVHGKPIARGYVARKSAAVARRDAQLVQAGRSLGALEALLEELGPAYVVVHKWSLQGPSERDYAATLAVRLRKSYEDAEVAVYEWRLAPDGSGAAP